MSKDQNQQNQNPLQIIFKASETCAQYIQKQLSHFIPNVHISSPLQPQRSSSSSQLSLLQTKEEFSKVMQQLYNRCPIAVDARNLLDKIPQWKPIVLIIDVPLCEITKMGSYCRFNFLSTPTPEQSARPLTKEELGRCTWTLLHTIAAQFPDHPTRQQRRDVKELMDILSRIYPCKECADHFKEVLRANPVQAGSHSEFAQWLCHVHNVVNRSIGKPIFPCQRVDARWGKLDCKDRACDVQGITLDFDKWPDK